jgi:hypothetical protein
VDCMALFGVFCSYYCCFCFRTKLIVAFNFCALGKSFENSTESHLIDKNFPNRITTNLILNSKFIKF